MPLLIFAGLPPTAANATNRLGIWIQSLFGLNKFRRMGFLPVRMSLVSVLPSLLGSFAGSYLATTVSDDTFKKYLAFFMLLMTIFTFFNPKPKNSLEDFIPEKKGIITASAVYFLIGVYGGFIQAGVGFFILAYCITYGLDYVRGNAVKMFLNLLTNTMSLAVFIYSGMIEWIPGIVMGAGMALGAVFAAGFSVRAGNVFLKRFVTAAVILFAVILLIT